MSRPSAKSVVSDVVKPPITFKEFSKDPVKGMLFIVLIAIGYLYIDIKVTNKDTITKQDIKNEKLEAKIDMLQNQVRDLISQAAEANAKYEMLQKLDNMPTK